MAASMFMNSNSLPIALMQSIVVSVPGLEWGPDDNKDSMLGRALTYLVLYSTLGMIVSTIHSLPSLFCSSILSCSRSGGVMASNYFPRLTTRSSSLKPQSTTTKKVHCPTRLSTNNHHLPLLRAVPDLLSGPPTFPPHQCIAQLTINLSQTLPVKKKLAFQILQPQDHHF